MKFRFFNTKSHLFKASYYNAIIVALKAFSSVATTMVVSRVVGPSGLALLGNLKNFNQTASSLTAEGYQNGTIRYISEYKDDLKQRERVVATIFQLSLGLSIFIGAVLLLFASNWSSVLFQTVEYSSIIRLLGLGLPFLSFNILLIYIYNGLEDYKKLVVLNAVLSFINMMTTVFLVYQYGLEGGLVGVLVGPIIAFLVNVWALGEDRSILLNVFKFNLFSAKILKSISGYLFMAIYSTAIVSVSFLIVRNLIINKLTTENAGFWEAMNRVSGFYTMFFVSLTSFYLLPRLSSMYTIKAFKNEMKSFYKFSIPLLIVVFTSIYFLRFFLLTFLLGKEFIPTEELFFWQLIGDFISILAIALVKQFHAKRMIKAYLICNGLKSLLYVCFSYYFIDSFGLEGTIIAYTLSYFFNVISTFFRYANNSFIIFIYFF